MKRWQLKAKSKEILKGQWNRFAGFSLLYGLISLLFSLPSLGFSNNGNALSMLIPAMPLWTVLYIVSILIHTFFLFGYLDMYIKVRAGMPVSVANLFYPFVKKPFRVICYSLILLALQAVYSLLLYVCIWLAAPLAFILSAALVFFYTVLMVRLSMVPIILLENPYTTVPDAFIQSYNVMRGNTFRYFVLQLSFLGWALLSMCTAGIALLWLSPYIQMTVVNFYYDIKSQKLVNSQAEAR